jgi:hypothetical protein
LERSRGGRIAFDEVHHGETQRATGAGAIFQGPLLASVGLGAATVLLFLALSGRRIGRAVPAEDPSRVPTAADFVAAVGQLFERSRRRGAVARRYAEELKERVGAGTGIDRRLDDGEFVSALRGFGEVEAEAVRDVLQRARQLEAGAPSDADLLALARRVDAVERRWTAGADV